MSDALVPVTVLTGFLGAGKTTLLNRILTENHGRRYAVVINEFGELGVDNDLVVDADEEVFEMNNGCICCTVRGDLIRILGSLMKRAKKFDGIIVETTGLANPAPVAQTFFRRRKRAGENPARRDRNGRRRQEPAGAACRQRGGRGADRLRRRHRAEQARSGHTGGSRRRRGAHRRHQPAGARNARDPAAVPVTEILHQNAFDLNRILQFDPAFLDQESHGHTEGVYSISVEASRPIVMQKFQEWMGTLLQEKGQDLLRTKGILNVAGDNRRFAFQAVHMMADGDFIGPAAEGDARASRLVFIGRDLNRRNCAAASRPARCLRECFRRGRNASDHARHAARAWRARHRRLFRPRQYRGGFRARRRHRAPGRGPRWRRLAAASRRMTARCWRWRPTPANSALSAPATTEFCTAYPPPAR